VDPFFGTKPQREHRLADSHHIRRDIAAKAPFQTSHLSSRRATRAWTDSDHDAVTVRLLCTMVTAPS
jgi:hypothetical protein